MLFISHRPGNLLRQYVYWFVYYEDFNPEDMGFRMISEGTVDILIPLGGQTRVYCDGSGTVGIAAGMSLLIGPQKSFMRYDTSKCTRAFGIVFMPGGAAKFSRLSIGELTNSFFSTGDIFGSEFQLLQEQLYEEKEPVNMFRIVEQFLIKRYNPDLRYAKEIDYAISAIQKGETLGGSLVAFAEKTIGFSHKHFVELFNDQVGLSPKRFQQIVRFNKVLEFSRHSPNLSWRQFAKIFGYVDPSHLAKDFHRLAGMTPGEFHGAAWTHRQVLFEKTPCCTFIT